MRTPLVTPGAVRPRPAEASATENLRGAGLMVLSMAAFTFNDATMKYVAQSLPLYQAITMRGVLIMGILLLVARRQGGLDLRIARSDFGTLGWRTVGEVGSTILFLNALTHMAIGDVAAVMQSLPLVVMLGAALFFGETLGWRRITAALLGLTGVMLILRPGTGTFDGWSLAVLGAVGFVALRDLVTRRFDHALRSSTIAFYAATSVSLAAAVMSVGQGWRMPGPDEAGLLLLASGCLAVGYVSSVAAMRVGEMSFVAPFRYTSLVFAILLGVLVFGVFPDGWTWAGSALVVGAGVYSLWRESVLRARR